MIPSSLRRPLVLQPCRSLALAIGLLTCTAIAPGYAATALRVESSPGDFVGAGQLWQFDDGNATFSATCSAGVINVTVEGSTRWTLAFASPAGQPLPVNELAEGAGRYLVQSPKRPGLDITGNGSSCNTVEGNFVVREFACGAGNTVDKLAIDAEQACENLPGPSLRAYLRMNSTVPVIVPQPKASAGVDQIATEGDLVTLDGSRSRGPAGVISRSWRQVSGPAVTLSDASAVKPTLVAPSVVAGGEVVVLELEVTGSDNLTDTDRMTMWVRDSNDPQTRLTVVSHPDAAVGAGITRSLSSIDSELADSSCSWIYAGVRFRGDSYWSINLQAPQGGLLTNGAFENAARYPFQAANQPGLDVAGDGACNELRGRFVLHELACVSDKVDRIAVDIEQRCGPSVGPWQPPTYTFVRVNSSIPVPDQVDRGCRLDVDGDGALSIVHDGSGLLRGLAGLIGTALAGPLNAPPNATRSAGFQLERYFQHTCAILPKSVGPTYCSLDLDGDGKIQLTTDGVIATRLIAGLSGDTALANATASGATRTTWAQLAPYLSACKLLPSP